jgi:hypothetical protein
MCCTRLFLQQSPGFIVFDVVVRATGCASGGQYVQLLVFLPLSFLFWGVGFGLVSGQGWGWGAVIDGTHGMAEAARRACVVLC